MIRHPLSAPTILGDGPTSLGERRRFSRPGDFMIEVRHFFSRRGYWGSFASELVLAAVFDARCARALGAGRRAARPAQGGRGRGALPSSFFTKGWKGGSYVAHSARD